MLGGQHERQEWFVRGFEGPDAIESRVIGKPCLRWHLFQLVYKQARVKLHRVEFFCCPDSHALPFRAKLGIPPHQTGCQVNHAPYNLRFRFLIKFL